MPLDSLYLSVGVDHAERYSAVVAVDRDGAVYSEMAYDHGHRDDQMAKDISLDLLITDVVHLCQGCTGYRLLVEDIPPHGMVNPKPVLRQQGVLSRELRRNAVSYEWVLPRQWQLPLGYRRKDWSTSKAWAKARAQELGHVSTLGGKSAVDSRDAFLLAYWGMFGANVVA